MSVMKKIFLLILTSFLTAFAFAAEMGFDKRNYLTTLEHITNDTLTMNVHLYERQTEFGVDTVACLGYAYMTDKYGVIESVSIPSYITYNNNTHIPILWTGGYYSTAIKENVYIYVNYCKELRLPSTLKMLYGSICGLNLEKIWLPKGLEYIQCGFINNFYTSIPNDYPEQVIVLEEGNEHYCIENGVLYTKQKDKLICYPYWLVPEDGHFVVPESVTEIRPLAFCFNKNLRSVELPSNLRIIGENAFDNSGLESIDLPNSIDSIGSHAFYECPLKGHIELPQNLRYIQEHILAQYLENGISSVSIPRNAVLIEHPICGSANEDLTEIYVHSPVKPEVLLSRRGGCDDDKWPKQYHSLIPYLQDEIEKNLKLYVDYNLGAWKYMYRTTKVTVLPSSTYSDVLPDAITDVVQEKKEETEYDLSGRPWGQGIKHGIKIKKGKKVVLRVGGIKLP